MNREKIAFGVFDVGGGSTGGKFYEEDAETRAFNEAAEKKEKDRANVINNRLALECLIQKMQKKSVDIDIPSDSLTGHYRTHDNQYIQQHTNNFGVLSICGQLFLMKLNDKNEIHITNKSVDPNSGCISYETCFENDSHYHTLHMDDENSINKWAWDILNTAIKRDSFPNLKPFLNSYN